MITFEQIQEKAKSVQVDIDHNVNYPSLSVYCIAKANFEAGALWMQQNQSGMRWVRASERLPDEEGVYNMKWVGEIQSLHPFSSKYSKEKGFNGVIEGHYSLVFWLDESASSEVERLRKENEEMLTMLKGIAKDGFLYSTDISSLIQKIEANGTTDR